MSAQLPPFIPPLRAIADAYPAGRIEGSNVSDSLWQCYLIVLGVPLHATTSKMCEAWK